MTDYYAVLKKAIAGLDKNTSDTRRAVYDKARNALIGQLKAIDPPLTTSEISRQRLELEEAIRKVEREATVTTVGPQPARVRATAAVAEALSEPIDISDNGRPGPVLPEDTTLPPRPPAARAPEPVQPPQQAFRRPVSDAAERQPAPAPRAPAPEPAIPSREPAGRQEPTIGTPSSFNPGPPIAPNYGPEPEWNGDARYADQEDHFEEPPRRGRGARAPSRRQAEGGRSRLPFLLGLVVVLLVLAGVGAFAWSQRGLMGDVVGDLISSIEQSQPPPSLSEPGTEPATGVADQAPAKNDDRLDGDPGGGEPSGEARPVRTVDPATDSGETDPLANDDSFAGIEPPSEPAPAPAPAATAPGADGEALVAQKAILYEQPTTAGAGVQSVDARVTWRFNQNSPNGPEIQAVVDVPSRSMKVTVNIRKNNDQALPASHLVEIIVDTPADFSPGGVKTVPAFVMKPTEAARGTPLEGAAAKVADGFFWIAFSNDERLMGQNLSLMRERDWIDLPIVYENDQRAILTFEKGTPGQRVFEQALAAWG